MNNIFRSIHIQYQNTEMLKKKSMESMLNIWPFSEKIEKYEFYIFVPNSQNIEFIK